ncbi:MAG: sialidase family protein [Nitrososphaeraceae archaeon]
MVSSLTFSSTTTVAGLICFLALVFSFTSNTSFGSEKSVPQKDKIIEFLPVAQYNISNNEGDSVYPQIASYLNNTFVVWQDNSLSDISSNYEILVKRVDTDGMSNSGPINLSNNSGFSEHPQIAVYENNVYVVWADNTMSENREVMLSVSRDGGTTFDRAINLSNNTSDSFNQEISLNKNKIYVVWQDIDKTEKNSIDRGRIILQESMDNGKTFNKSIVLAKGTGTTTFPKVSASEHNEVHVTWNVKTADDIGKNGIFLKKSADSGNTFAHTRRLSDYRGSGESQVYASKDNRDGLFITWGGLAASPKESVDDLYVTKSNDNGTTFEAPRLVYESFRNSLNPEIIGNNGTIVLASQDSIVSYDGKRNEEVFLTSSSDGGSNFSELINISNNDGFSECPSLSVSNIGDLNVVWQDKTPGNNEVFFAKIERPVIEW